MTGQRIQQEAICYQWFKQRLILSVSKPSISQRSQIKEDTVEPSVPAREFILKAYAALTWHNDPASLGLESRLSDHRSQAARTATLPIAPRGAGLLAIVKFLFIFTARRVCIARTMPWQDVCLSVRLPHAGIMSERLYISSKIFLQSDSPTILVFPYQTRWQYSDGDPLTGASDEWWYGKITIFDQYRALSRNWCKIEL